METCQAPRFTRLESMIRRLTAQRDILDRLCAEVPAGGLVLELGLGNGRTYDHLRARLPGRRIIAFDRTMTAQRQSAPPAGDFVAGEIGETAARLVGCDAALVHVDIATEDAEADRRTLVWLPGLIAGLLASDGVAVSGMPLDHPALVPELSERGDESRPGYRYFVYRKA